MVAIGRARYVEINDALHYEELHTDSHNIIADKLDASECCSVRGLKV